MSKDTIYKLLGIIFVSIHHIFAATVIDIDSTNPFTEGYATSPQLRIVTYDVTQQKFLQIQYFNPGKQLAALPFTITTALLQKKIQDMIECVNVKI